MRTSTSFLILGFCVFLFVGGDAANGQIGGIDNEARSFVGTFENVKGFSRIALVMKKRIMTAYICGDEKFTAKYGGWYLNAKVSLGDEFALVGPNGQMIRGELDRASISGAIIQEGGPALLFHAAQTATNGPAGLWRSQGKVVDDVYLLGAILDENGWLVANYTRQAEKKNYVYKQKMSKVEPRPAEIENALQNWLDQILLKPPKLTMARIVAVTVPAKVPAKRQ